MSKSIQRSCLVLLLLGLSGCGKGARHQSSSAAASASAKPPVLAPRVDVALLGTLSNLAKSCKMDVKEGNLTCSQGEQRQLVGEFVSNQRSRNTAVATFAAALGDADVMLSAVAANVLHSAFRSPWGNDSSKLAVDPTDAEKLLAATLKLSKVQARQALPAAVHAMMLSGRSEALYAALDKASDSEFRLIGNRYLLSHGRLTAFKHIQLSAKDPSSAVVLSALESPRNMYVWTAAEQAAICPWAASFLADQRPAVAAKAGSVLSSCSGEWVDRLLDAGEQAVAAKSFSGMQLVAFRDLCAPYHAERESGPTADQCKRSRALLEKAINGNGLDEQTRSTALTTVAYQWPDEGTLKLARKLTKAKEPSLAEVARRTAQNLEQRGAGAAKAGAAAKDKPAVGAAAPKPGAPRPAVAPAAPPPEVPADQ